MTASIEVDDDDIRGALQRLMAATGDASPALASIGEILVPSTRRRFSTKTGPDGEAWKRNAEATIARKVRCRIGSLENVDERGFLMLL
jgi:hypothetical protein